MKKLAHHHFRPSLVKSEHLTSVISIDYREMRSLCVGNWGLYLRCNNLGPRAKGSITLLIKTQAVNAFTDFPSYIREIPDDVRDCISNVILPT